VQCTYRYRLVANREERTGGATEFELVISYGADTEQQWQGAASYVDRILRGEKASELAVQLPAKFILSINLKTAKALGLEVSWFLQQRADEVIE